MVNPVCGCTFMVSRNVFYLIFRIPEKTFFKPLPIKRNQNIYLLTLQEIESKENVTAKSSQVFNENINLIEESKEVEETLNSASGQITADVDADEDIMASIDIGIEDHQSKEEDTFVESSKKLVSEER